MARSFTKWQRMVLAQALLVAVALVLSIASSFTTYAMIGLSVIVAACVVTLVFDAAAIVAQDKLPAFVRGRNVFCGFLSHRSGPVHGAQRPCVADRLHLLFRSGIQQPGGHPGHEPGHCRLGVLRPGHRGQLCDRIFPPGYSVSMNIRR